MKFFWIPVIMLCALAACNNHTNTAAPAKADTINNTPASDTFSRFVHQFNDTVLEKRIIDTLMRLPFVKKSDAYIDSFSNHTHGLAFMLDTAGNSIAVTAGYSGPERFENYYIFKIDPVTFRVQVQDMETGDWIPVERYGKLNAAKK